MVIDFASSHIEREAGERKREAREREGGKIGHDGRGKNRPQPLAMAWLMARGAWPAMLVCWPRHPPGAKERESVR